MEALLIGAIAGVVGTFAMTAGSMLLFDRLPRRERYPLPPREITQVIVERASRVPVRQELAVPASLASHFAFGALCGIGLTALGLHRRRPVAHGIAYGVAVWAGSYLGWIPASGILTPAVQHPGRRTALMIAVHVIWGAATGAAAASLAASERTLDSRGPDAKASLRDVPAPERARSR